MGPKLLENAIKAEIRTTRTGDLAKSPTTRPREIAVNSPLARQLSMSGGLTVL
jgi:hypothetical protein